MNFGQYARFFVRFLMPFGGQNILRSQPTVTSAGTCFALRSRVLAPWVQAAFGSGQSKFLAQIRRGWGGASTPALAWGWAVGGWRVWCQRLVRQLAIVLGHCGKLGQRVVGRWLVKFGLCGTPEPVGHRSTLLACLLARYIGQGLDRTGTRGGHVRGSGLVEALDGGQGFKEAPRHRHKAGEGDATELHPGMADIQKRESQPCIGLVIDHSVFDGERDLTLMAAGLDRSTYHSQAYRSIEPGQLGHLASVGAVKPVVAQVQGDQ